jgi:hypothetical protein
MSPMTRSRARFSAEEDEILLETIHHAIKTREPWNGYVPYKQLAIDVSAKILQADPCLTTNSSRKERTNPGEIAL